MKNENKTVGTTALQLYNSFHCNGCVIFEFNDQLYCTKNVSKLRRCVIRAYVFKI